MSERDNEQDKLIHDNTLRITRNEEAIKRQTEALEQIRDHYYPPSAKGFRKRTIVFCGKVVCVIMAYLGIAEAVGWLWNTHKADRLAAEYAEGAQRLFFEEGLAEGAKQCYEKAIALDDGKMEYKVALTLMKGMALGADLFNIGRPLTDDERAQVDESMSEATVLMNQHPKNPMPHVLMAQGLMARGEREAAVAEVMQAVEYAPDVASIRVSACVMQFNAGHMAEARKQLAEAERLDGSLMLVSVWKGILAQALDHDLGTAKAYFEKVTRQSPHNAIGYALLGRVLLDEGGAKGKSKDADTASLQAARAACHKALILNPKQKMALLGMAETYEREGKLGVAHQWLDLAISRDMNHLPAFIARARINEKEGNLKAAINDLTAALGLSPFDAKLYRLRADIYEKAGNAESAAADRQMVAELGGSGK